MSSHCGTMMYCGSHGICFCVSVHFAVMEALDDIHHQESQFDLDLLPLDHTYEVGALFLIRIVVYLIFFFWFDR